MSRPSIIFAAVALIVSATSLATGQSARPAAAQNSEAPANRVRKLYHDAQSAFAAGNAAESKRLLLEAWKIQPDADVALALGQTELNLNQYRDCAEHLEFAIRNYSAASSESVLKVAKQAFSEAKTHIGEVTITTNRDGAEIRLDDHTIGVSPSTYPVYVEPGRHKLEVQQGSAISNEIFEVAPGQTHNSNLVLQEGAPAQTTTSSNPQPVVAGTSSPKTGSDSERRIGPVVVGGTVLVVGLVTAIGFRLASDSKYSDADKTRAAAGQGSCRYASSSSDCTAIHQSNTQGDTYRNWSTVGIVAAATALVGTSAYLLWPSSNSTTAAGFQRLRLAPNATSNQASITVAGEF